MVFEMTQIINALIGGVLIGVSASMMLLLKGRVMGISGILAGSFTLGKEGFWRLFFLLGVLLGGLVLLKIYPQSFFIGVDISTIRVIIAGVLVGFGTRLGSGCTSGHGVCGISRLSKRSIVATMTFIGAGVLTVFFFGVS